MLIEFVAGAAIGTWWQQRRPMPGPVMSALLLVGGYALLACRNLPPLGQFTQMAGAALMVTGALSPRFSDWHFTPLRALGDSSYSLYLTHLFTLGLLRVLWSRVVPPVETWTGAATFMAVALVGASVVGWLTYRLLETPMMEWLNARTRPRRVVQASTP
jgi:exopolysaccharide production protein ExoZ